MGTTVSAQDQKFFYALDEAEHYDVTVELTQPYYWLIHMTLVNLLQYHFSLHGQLGGKTRDLNVLDLGSGSGAEALGIISTFPGTLVIAFDFSSKMHQLLRDKFSVRFPTLDISRSLVTVCQDFLYPETNSSFCGYLPSERATRGYDAVVSAFALHHYDANQKKELYARIYESLPPGGLFLNADLFTFSSVTLTKHSEEFGENWIYQQFTDPIPELKETAESLGADREPLLQKWIEHWRNDNVPLPFEATRSSVRHSSEVDILKEVGFTEVECPFRFWLAGILWALK